MLRVWSEVPQNKNGVQRWARWLKNLPEKIKSDIKSGAVDGKGLKAEARIWMRVTRPAVSVDREYKFLRGWLGVNPSHPPDSSHVLHFAFNSTEKVKRSLYSQDPTRIYARMKTGFEPRPPKS